jgi:nicotinamidase-related amidase
MTTLPGRDNTALLVIDMQYGAAEGGVDLDGVVANIGSLVERARAAEVPVIWVQHADEDMPVGSDAWQYLPELVWAEGEPVVQKNYGDAFEETTLEELLAAASVGRLVVTGAQTDYCVRSTLHGALARGYDATLVSDGHTTVDLTEYGAPPPEQVIAHTNMYWSGQEVPGRTGGVLAAADVEF